MMQQVTKASVLNLTQELMPLIVDLWKTERVCNTDDLVAIIDNATNQIYLKTRKEVCRQLQNKPATKELVQKIKQPVLKRANGSIAIWTLIGYPDGKICILPLTIARS